MVGDHGQAEDLAQTALAKTYAHWSRLRDTTAAPAYARRVIVTTATSWFRRRGFRGEQPTEHLPETGGDRGGGEDLTQRIDLAHHLRRLPARASEPWWCCGSTPISPSPRRRTSWGSAREPSRARPPTRYAACGRTLRRRRAAATAAGICVLALIVGTGVIASGTFSTRDDADGSDPAGPTTATANPNESEAAEGYAAWGTWAVGPQLAIGPSRYVTLEDRPAALAQTLVGVVAQSSSAPDLLTLITPTGVTSELTAAPAATIVGDVHESRIAWVEATEGGLTVHVWDVDDDRQLAAERIDLPEADGSAPIVLDGDLVYVASDAGSVAVDWATGTVANLSLPRVSSVRGEVAAAYVSDEVGWRTIDPTTGDVRATIGPEYDDVVVSPDGTWVAMLTEGYGVSVMPSGGGTVLNIPELDAATDLTWTPASQLIVSAGDQIVGCVVEESAATCDSTTTDADGAPVVLP